MEMNLRQLESKTDKYCITVDTEGFNLKPVNCLISNQRKKFGTLYPNRLIDIFLVGNKNQDDITDEFVIEDVIVEYGSPNHHYNPLLLQKFGCNLEYFICIGIPVEKYDRIISKASERAKQLVDYRHSQVDDYVWIPCDIFSDQNSTISGFFVRDCNHSKSTKLGTIYDVVSKFKSNMIGHGIFNICTLGDETGNHLYWVLNSFHVKEKTSISGYMSGNLNVVTDGSLLEDFKSLGFNVLTLEPKINATEFCDIY